MEYKLLKQERKFNGWMKVDGLTLQQKTPTGEWSKEFTREVILRGDAVIGLIVDPVNETLLLTSQLRPGGILQNMPYINEMVAGMIDEGESHQEALKREAFEETGVKELSNIELIASYLPSCGSLSEKVHLYYAEADLTGLPEFGGCPGENEVIKIIVISYKEAFEWQKEGKIGTGNGHIALNWLKYKLVTENK